MNEQAVASAEQPKKIGSLKRSWIITKSAWRVLTLDKELLAIPFVGGLIGILIAVAGYGGGILLSPDVVRHSGLGQWSYKSDGSLTHASYAVWIATSAILALLSSYTVAAIVAMALKRLRGGDPTLRDGIGAVKKHFRALTIFSLVSFGIVQILNQLQERLPFAGKLLAFLGELAWRAAGFFSIPIIVDREEFIGPFNATKESVALIKKTWKESSVNQFTIGAIFAIVLMLEVVIGTLTTAVASIGVGASLGIFVGAMFLFLAVVICLVSSAMEGIAKSILYYYAVTGEAPASFDRRLLEEAFTAKKARKIFA